MKQTKRDRLAAAVHVAIDHFEHVLTRMDGSPTEAKKRLDAAQAALDAWDNHILQVISPPHGMVAVFERSDGLEEVIPVSYLARHRSGRVLPYIYVGNCEPKTPVQYATFLRIDFQPMMAGEVDLGVEGKEDMSPLKEEEEEP